MSVASLSGYLANGGSGGNTFTTVTLGNDSTSVILGCTNDDQLSIASGTAATRQWVDANYVEKRSDATLTSLSTPSITIFGDTENGVLTVSADGTQLLFNGVAVQMST